MENWIQTERLLPFFEANKTHVINIGIALGILLAGWFVAWTAQRIVLGALRRTTWDNRVIEWLGLGHIEGRVEKFAAKTVYYVVLVFTLVAFFERLKVKAVTAPLTDALSSVTTAVPSLLKALIIAAIGFVAATALKKATTALLLRTGIARTIEKWGSEATTPAKKRSKKEEDVPTIVTTLGEVAFWFVIFMTAIPVLDALKMSVLAAPLSGAVGLLSLYVPRLIGAALVLLAGYVIAKLTRVTVAALCRRLGFDAVLERAGFVENDTQNRSGEVLGTVAFAFVLLQFSVAALGRLGIAEISGPLSLILTQAYELVPRLFAAAILLLIGVALARISGSLTESFLSTLGLDSVVGKLKAASLGERAKSATASFPQGSKTPSAWGGLTVSALATLLFLRQALEVVGLDSLAALLSTALSFLPSALTALVVVVAGMVAGRWADARIAEATHDSGDRLLRATGPIARTAILVFASTIALEQLGVGRGIIALSFGLILGAVCLAFALSFGLGGREAAASLLRHEMEKRTGHDNQGQ